MLPAQLNRRQNSPSHSRQSLLDTKHLSANDILALFRKSEELLSIGARFGNYYDPSEDLSRDSRVICCLFFEASTRTRMSFQTAAYRLGHQVLTMELNSSSSLSKGESQLDTVLNIVAMNPDVLIVRYGTSSELDEILPQLPMPVINAGNGAMAHPTQGLLDAFTIFRERGGFEHGLRGERILIVGDIAHSRVARSNFDVLSKLGAEIAVCGPAALLPSAAELPKGTQIFHNLDDALAWPTVYMGLRIQLERHAIQDDLKNYHRRFGLDQARLKVLGENVMILHPGPINHGVEFSEHVIRDPRSRILIQVSNGVVVRAALLSRALGEWSSTISL